MDYARTLVEHPKWTWHIGMVAERGARVYDIGKGFAGYEVPDINHPSTKGWLLHMLREDRKTCDLATQHDERGWRVPYTGPGFHATEGEALAAALLAAWGPA